MEGSAEVGGTPATGQRETAGGRAPRWFRGLPPGLRYMAAGALFFSVMSLLVKVAGQRIPSQQVVLARSVVVLLLSYAALRVRGVRPWGERRRLLVLRGVLGYLALSCFYYAVVHLPLADATVIQYTNPVFTALLATVVLGEALRRREIACAALSLVGVLLIARPTALFGGSGGGLPPLAVSIGLAGAVLSASAYVLVRKLGNTEDSLVIVFYFAMVSVVASTPATAAVAVWPTGAEWLVLAGVGVTTQLGQVYMTRGLKRERAGRATAVGYLQIVFAAAWGAAFFAEMPDGWSVSGALLIVGSTLALGRMAAVAGPAPPTERVPGAGSHR